MAGTRNTWRRYSRFRAIGAGIASLSLAVTLAACGGESSSNVSEEEGTYRVKVVSAEFPTAQQLGQTSFLKLGVRNTGDETVPTVAVTISIAGEEGQTSMLPFGIHNPQPDLAQPDRPVWVLAAGSPSLAGSSEPAGTQTASRKTFDFGPLKPGAAVEGVWKLSAVKAGRFTLLYAIAAGLGGKAKAETAAGNRPEGSFAVLISDIPPPTTVTDSGEIVEIGKQKKPNK